MWDVRDAQCSASYLERWQDDGVEAAQLKTRADMMMSAEIDVQGKLPQAMTSYDF